MLTATILSTPLMAQLTTISDQHITLVKEKKTGEKLYWLATDAHLNPKQIPRALIALEKGKDAPMIDPETLESNFHYVSFQVLGDSYAKLPAGLHYWKRQKGEYTVDNEVQVRPTEQIRYIGIENQPAELIFFKINLDSKQPSKQKFDATKNPFALQNPKRETVIAYQAGSNILHPFDKPNWAYKLTGNKKGAAAQPYAAAVAQQPAASAHQLLAAKALQPKKPQQQAQLPAQHASAPKKQAKKPSPVSAQAGIACPACTYMNLGAQDTCEICETPLKPALPKKPVAAPQPQHAKTQAFPPKKKLSRKQGKVRCPHCAYWNVPTAAMCGRCPALLSKNPQNDDEFADAYEEFADAYGEEKDDEYSE